MTQYKKKQKEIDDIFGSDKKKNATPKTNGTTQTDAYRKIFDTTGF